MLLPPKTADLSEKVIQLCSKIVPGVKPFFLDVEMVDFTQPNECFPNVNTMVSKKGGSVQYGWQIWETIPNIMIEGEFHSVWVDQSGVYHDITPKEKGINKILFLPDNTRKYEQKQIDNIRMNLTNHHLIDDYINNAEAIFEATNRGELATSNQYILTPEISNLFAEKLSYRKLIEDKFTSPRIPDNPRNKACICGSGKKYKKCCGNK